MGRGHGSAGLTLRAAYIFLWAACVFLAACQVNTASSTPQIPSAPQIKGSIIADPSQKELIILAPPPDGDRYYAKVSGDIFDFHIAYARRIMAHDDVLILSGPKRYTDYVRALGKDHVLLAEMEDIWMRDFALSNAVAPVMFRYTAEGQGGGGKGQKDADAVQESFAKFIGKAGVEFAESDWLNDGGNFVDDSAGNVVISRKFLRDNDLNVAEGRSAIRSLTSANHIAFIESDEQGGLEHADGVVAFVAENTVVINSYLEDKAYAEALKADLRRSLPGVVIHEIITPYDGSRIYDERFGSACGLYTNMLVTPQRIYFPQFGITEDAIALKQLKNWTDLEIIPIMSSEVCQMGGGVRCMSWQTRGANAKALLAYAKSR